MLGRSIWLLGSYNKETKRSTLRNRTSWKIVVPVSSNRIIFFPQNLVIHAITRSAITEYFM